MFKVTGTVKVIGQTIAVTEKFTKRDLVITDQSQYPQDISFQLSQDKVDLLDSFVQGDLIEVSFNLRGREWANPTTGEVRYFNTLDAWRIEGLNQVERNNHQAEQVPTHQATGPANGTATEDDDLPF
jgi:hypothetical protein